MYQSEVGKLTADVASLREKLIRERSKEAEIQKNVADLERKLASKTKDLHDAEKQLANESTPEAFEDTADPETLAKNQGVPAATFDDLLGDFWPEDEEPEEFTSALGEWRRDPS